MRVGDRRAEEAFEAREVDDVRVGAEAAAGACGRCQNYGLSIEIWWDASEALVAPDRIKLIKTIVTA